MTHDRGIHLHAAAAEESDAKRKIDVLDVAKELFIETADAREPFHPIHRSRRAWAECFGIVRKGLHRLTVSAPPRDPETRVAIAGTVENVAVSRADLKRSEHRSIGMALRGAKKRLKPARLGKGIGVEENYEWGGAVPCAYIAAGSRPIRIPYGLRKPEHWVSKSATSSPYLSAAVIIGSCIRPAMR